ncbi:xanthine dehydrogenase family protein molybdopterin-binding subunit [Rhabdothermincola salaria]|uniref:xanthine dehydrogenase family protein molybdopterin-binding subunit n=1 Tax=Rhabdothermincola salaria TaxID=2903142 RepID=UPI001E4AD4C8|nr:xanthine dehydrogenase family protein molybdopterin-binding subunit [Rhabdothermincola salaria]MCD9624707.1 xanthine dehydrogenase family protein molybdopterin-binding subunit [Rhabdothermincola salaria]
MSILGHRVLRREDPALLTDGGTYVDDIVRDGAAHVVYVRSTVAHGHIESIDTDEARTAPGVLAVVTAADIDLPDLVPLAIVDQAMTRPVLATDTVRFVGEPVVAVVAETRNQAVDAAEAVIVDIEPRPALVDPEAALEPDAPLLFPAAGTNAAMVIDHHGDPVSFDDCDVVVTTRTVNQRVAPVPIEARSALAWWEDDRLVVEIGCQGPHPVRTALAEAYGLDPEQIRVVCPDVGGGFGAKAQIPAEALLLGELARRIDRPVRWSETRSENLVGMNHGRGQVQTVTLGGTADGHLTTYRLEVVQDAGGYPTMGAILPFATRIMASGVYDIAEVEYRSRSVATTTTPTGAYRGAGRPEAAAALERAVDLFAAEAGLDPADVRRRNFVAPDAFPFQTPMGTTYDSGDYEGALDRVLAAAGYDDLRAEQARRRAADDSRLLGIGLGCYVEITAMTGGEEFASVQLRPDGTALVVTGSNPYGQGHVTSWAMLVAERTGLPLDRIEVVYGDTDVVPHGEVTGGSRSAQVAGSSVDDAAGKLVALARDRAADLLEAAVDDVVLDAETGAFHVVGTPAISVDWAAVADTADTHELLAVSDFSSGGPSFPFGAHVAVVEVDRDTGQVDLVRMVACDDAGRILNPLIVDGQVHGGLAQGIAQALFEEVRYDPDGNPVTATLIDYAVPSAAELPSFERVPMETPSPMNPLGAKGIGESGTIGSTPAVQNAVIDALAHLGVRHIDMPLTPERVWRALQEL